MKLTDIKKKADTKAAEVEAARRQAQLIKELDVHPLLKWGCARDVRDAYFSGIVFAAMTDDIKVDDLERRAINRVGHSLALSDAEVDEFIVAVSRTVHAAIDKGGSEVFALLEEVAAELKDEKAFRLFVAEYVKVCGAKEFDAADVLNQVQEHIASKAGQNVNQYVFEPIRSVVEKGVNASAGDLLVVSNLLGEDVCRYFMLDVRGDVIDEIRSERKRCEAAECAARHRAEAEAARNQERHSFDVWLDDIAHRYELKKIPEGLPAALCRRAKAFDVSKLDLQEIKRKIVSNCRQSQRRMAWKLLGYFALIFDLTDSCAQTRSVEYLMKTTFGRNRSIWGGDCSGKDVVQAFKDCIEKYDA